MWSMYRSYDLPSQPSSKDLEAFSTTHAFQEHILTARQLPLCGCDISQSKVASPPREDMKVKPEFLFVDDPYLEIIRQTCAHYCFNEWKPDLLGRPYDLYNSACCIAFLDSFR